LAFQLLCVTIAISVEFYEELVVMGINSYDN